MTLHTLWDSIKKRVSDTPAPKKPRKPRQPTPAQPEQQHYSITDEDRKTIVEFIAKSGTMQAELRSINRSLSGHHDRIHELEQIEHRRSEREKEMKIHGKEGN